MSTPALPTRPDAAAAVHLRIHTADDAGRQGWRFGALLQRVRARFLAPPRHGRTPLALEIHDLQGHSVLALDLAGPLVDVALPPGVYRVTAQRGATRRSYTVALGQDSPFDLHLRLPHDPR